MRMQLTVALAGEEAAGGQALRLLAKRGHRVAAVFSDSEGSGRGATVADVAATLRIPVRPAAEVCDSTLADELRARGVELLLNIHSLHIVAAEVLAAPRLGAYNLHPGPLPERAGLNAPGWALYEGDEVHGVTLHRMTPGVDEGPIAFIERFDVGTRDTALEVMVRCVRRGLSLVERLLDLAEQGDPIPAHPQDLSRRRWFGAGPPEGGRLDWDRPARRVADFVRACSYGPFRSPWAFPRCAADRGEVAIAAAEALPEPAAARPGTVVAADPGAVLVAAADTWVRVDRVEIGGERPAAAAVLRPGERLRALASSDGGTRDA
jgi:UDP-4-amino-4-deoxy-L-arabinose formyltransferase/UDP-glucuronic acid dehydrogenase (UDP-4-keto-hexauronic acid decarboxylating)